MAVGALSASAPPSLPVAVLASASVCACVLSSVRGCSLAVRGKRACRVRVCVCARARGSVAGAGQVGGRRRGGGGADAREAIVDAQAKEVAEEQRVADKHDASRARAERASAKSESAKWDRAKWDRAKWDWHGIKVSGRQQEVRALVQSQCGTRTEDRHSRADRHRAQKQIRVQARRRHARARPRSVGRAASDLQQQIAHAPVERRVRLQSRVPPFVLHLQACARACAVCACACVRALVRTGR